MGWEFTEIAMYGALLVAAWGFGLTMASTFNREPPRQLPPTEQELHLEYWRGYSAGMKDAIGRSNRWGRE